RAIVSTPTHQHDPELGKPGISLELILNTLGLDDPLIIPIPVLMNKLGGLIIIHRLNALLAVLHIRALHSKLVDKHLPRLIFLTASASAPAPAPVTDQLTKTLT
ncbi:hypothetical protein AB723_19320, partial [Acinetobacter baumannii]